MFVLLIRHSSSVCRREEEEGERGRGREKEREGGIEGGREGADGDS